MGNIESDWRNILSGVLQGLVLEPLIFVVCIIDLPDGLESILKMYDDDSKVIAESHSKVNGNIIKIVIDKWYMFLDSSKCKVMHKK